jgi:hypothetical protein
MDLSLEMICYYVTAFNLWNMYLRTSAFVKCRFSGYCRVWCNVGCVFCRAPVEALLFMQVASLTPSYVGEIVSLFSYTLSLTPKKVVVGVWQLQWVFRKSFQLLFLHFSQTVAWPFMSIVLCIVIRWCNFCYLFTIIIVLLVLLSCKCIALIWFILF